jgi:hypothetical protein
VDSKLEAAFTDESDRPHGVECKDLWRHDFNFLGRADHCSSGVGIRLTAGGIECVSVVLGFGSRTTLFRCSCRGSCCRVSVRAHVYACAKHGRLRPGSRPMAPPGPQGETGARGAKGPEGDRAPRLPDTAIRRFPSLRAHLDHAADQPSEHAALVLHVPPGRFVGLGSDLDPLRRPTRRLVTYQSRNAETSRAERSPERTAPPIYPFHIGEVSVPAQWIRPRHS